MPLWASAATQLTCGVLGATIDACPFRTRLQAVVAPADDRLPCRLSRNPWPSLNALLQKPRIDVVGALATIGLLDDHRNELVLVGIARISHVASFGHADRHQRKFLAV